MQTTPKIAITTEKRVPETEVSDDDPGACRKKSWLSQFKNSITRLDSFSEVPFLKKKKKKETDRQSFLHVPDQFVCDPVELLLLSTKVSSRWKPIAKN